MAAKPLSPTLRLLILVALFLLFYFVPFTSPSISGAVQEALLMLSEYAQQHVLLCLIPAFFIAGAISVFLNQQAIIQYLGPKAKKALAYSVASVSGAILAVCSCTVLPLFKGIYRRGAGLGPAISFLYSGPAINVLAIFFSAKVLGWEIGLARALGAIIFAFVIGLLMQLIFRREDEKRLADERMFQFNPDNLMPRKLWQDALPLSAMIAILVFLNWSSSQGTLAFWDFIYQIKYWIVGTLALFLALMLWRWFQRKELKDWVISTRDFAIQILPLLFAGVFLSGFLLGRPGHEGIIPGWWIASLVGGNSFGANLLASFSGALMYFATLTEVPIVQGLLGSGMGHGPALALLLAGPSLSLPSILVISSELGWKKTLTYVGLVVVMSSLVGWLFGIIYP